LDELQDPYFQKVGGTYPTLTPLCSASDYFLTLDFEVGTNLPTVR